MAFLLMAGGTAGAQPAERDPPAEVGGAPGELSEHVDEREDSYRKSMELQEDGFRQRPRANTTYTSRGSQEKIDQLPLPSQENIKGQLRDMIIERGEWEPGEDLSDYPYEPSTAAQSDGSLARQEREAWAEQVGKYQQREAAAHAGQPDGAAGAEGAEAGQAQDAQGGGATGAASSAQDAADAQRTVAADAQSADAAPAETPVAGVAESALGFLQGRGAAAGDGPGGPLASGAAQASAAPGDSPEAAPAAGASGEAEVARDGQAQATQAAAEQAQAGRAPAEQAETEQAGSLALEELGRLQGLAGPAAGGPGSIAGINGTAESPGPNTASAGAAPGTGTAGVEETAAVEPAESGAAEPGAPANSAALAGTLALTDLRQLDDALASGQKSVDATDARAESPAEPVSQSAPALTPTATADAAPMSNPAAPPASAPPESAPVDADPVEPGTLNLAELGRVRGVAEPVAAPPEPAPPPDQP